MALMGGIVSNIIVSLLLLCHVFIMGQLHLCNGPLSLLVPPLAGVCVSVLIAAIIE